MDEKQRTVPCILQGQKQKIINENLLINWDFRDPINIKGYKTYIGNLITIDRWWHNTGDIPFVVDDGYVRFPDVNKSIKETDIWQRIERKIKLPCYITISVIWQDISNKGNSGWGSQDIQLTELNYRTVISDDKVIKQGNILFTDDKTALYSKTYYLDGTETLPGLGMKIVAGISPTGAGGFDIYAAKVEFGREQTLGELGEDGKICLLDTTSPVNEYAKTIQYTPYDEWQGTRERITRTVYCSPDGINAMGRGGQDRPFRTVAFAAQLYNTDILTVILAPGSGYGGLNNFGYVILRAQDPNNKPIMTNFTNRQNAFLSCDGIRFENSGGGGDVACFNSGHLNILNCEFQCTKFTGNYSCLELAGGSSYIANSSFNNYSQSVLFSWNGRIITPSRNMMRDCTGTNPTNMAVLQASGGTEILYYGTAPTNSNGVTTHGELYGGVVKKVG